MKPNLPPSNHKPLLDHADALGSMLSSLCAVHCICLPALLGLLPVLGLSFLANHTFERVVCVTAVLFASACVWSGCRVHRRWGLFCLLGAGAALVLYIQFAGPPEEKEQADWQEATVMAVGGSLIVASHILNRKLRAQCHCAQCDSSRKKTKS